MATNYTGNPTAVQTPATAPAVNNPVVISIPAGTDVRTIESITQALRVGADNLTFLLNIVGGTTTAKALQIDGAGGVASTVAAGCVQLSARLIAKNSGTVPTFTAGTGAGTSPSLSFSAGSTDLAGRIIAVTGTAPVASSQVLIVKLSIGGLRAAPPVSVMLTPANAITGALSGTQSVSIGGSGNDWNILSGTAALTASTIYSWYYVVVEGA